MTSTNDPIRYAEAEAAEQARMERDVAYSRVAPAEQRCFIRTRIVAVDMKTSDRAEFEDSGAGMERAAEWVREREKQ